MKYTDIRGELESRYQSVINYLIENHGNPNKINSNLDMAWENLHEIEAMMRKLQGYHKDLTKLKDMVIDLSMQQDKGEDITR